MVNLSFKNICEIPKGQSETVNRRRSQSETVNRRRSQSETVNRRRAEKTRPRKRTKGQTTIYKTQHRKLKIEGHELL